MGGTVLSQVVGYYMGNKNDFGSGGDIGPPLSGTWVPDGVQNTLGKMGIWTVGGVVRCRAFLEVWYRGSDMGFRGLSRHEELGFEGLRSPNGGGKTPHVGYCFDPCTIPNNFGL